MLASLLPGLREVRTPLTVGYLWFLNLWLWFGDELPRQASDSDWPVVQRVFELSTLLGTGITLAAISFAAYLLGSMVSFRFPLTMILIELKTFIPTKEYRVAKVKIDPQRLIESIRDTGNRVARIIINPFMVTSINAYKQAAKELGTAAQNVPRNRYDLRTRLMVADKELFGEYDRLTAESQFRLSVALPLTLAAVTILITAGLKFWWAWLVVLPAISIFVFQGLARDLDAVTVLMRAIIVEKIDASYLTKNEGSADRFV